MPAGFPPPVASSMVFRPMREEELDAVLAIEYSVTDFPWGRGHFTDSMNSGYACWSGYADGALAGFYVLMPVVDEAHLLTISVGPKYQRCGYGRCLLHHAMNTARLGGAERMLLEVRPSNTKALGLYRQIGFEQIGRRRGYYPAAGGREDALVLVCPLIEAMA